MGGIVVGMDGSKGSAQALQRAMEEARLLLLRGRPLREPIRHHGPFVMNTDEEIRQAIADFEAGRLATAPASVA